MTVKKGLQKELRDNKNIEQCASCFGVTGDRTRLKICYLLCHHSELSVSQIADTLGSPVSTVSRSLKKLKKVNVVSRRCESNNVFYSLEDNSFVSLLKSQLLA